MFFMKWEFQSCSRVGECDDHVVVRPLCHYVASLAPKPGRLRQLQDRMVQNPTHTSIILLIILQAPRKFVGVFNMGCIIFFRECTCFLVMVGSVAGDNG